MKNNFPPNIFPKSFGKVQEPQRTPVKELNSFEFPDSAFAFKENGLRISLRFLYQISF